MAVTASQARVPAHQWIDAKSMMFSRDYREWTALRCLQKASAGRR